MAKGDYCLVFDKNPELSRGDEFAFIPSTVGAWNYVTRATRMVVVEDIHDEGEIVQVHARALAPLTPGLVDQDVAWRCAKTAGLRPLIGRVGYQHKR